MEKIGFGVAPAKVDLRDYKAKFKGVATAAQFPVAFELPMPAVKNQKNVGSCVAHSLSTVIEYFNNAETGEMKTMSTGYIYGNRRNSSWKEAGMRVRDALKNATTYGDVQKYLFPANIEVPEAIELFENTSKSLIPYGKVNRIAKFFKLTDTKSIKQCLMKYGPVLVIVKWYDDNYVKDGILYITGNEALANGQHCMVCYGWDQKGWKIQNSWGATWGTLGRTTLPFSTKFVEIWGLMDEDNNKADGLEIKRPYNTKAGEVLVKGINKLINFILKRE